MSNLELNYEYFGYKLPMKRMKGLKLFLFMSILEICMRDLERHLLNYEGIGKNNWMIIILLLPIVSYLSILSKILIL